MLAEAIVAAAQEQAVVEPKPVESKKARKRLGKDDRFIAFVVGGGPLPLAKAAELSELSQAEVAKVVRWCGGKDKLAQQRYSSASVSGEKGKEVVEVVAREGWREAFVAERAELLK